MVFSSIQAYLDSSNWQQAPPSNYNQGGAGASATGGHGLRPQLQPQSQPLSNCSGGSGSIRPGSMVDRARQANVAMPEVALKCPRCESTNTKFCYFNNYSLTQPRHFCKTCRRYWTRGGALRNVPVGGGCRRNRRTKSSSNNNNSSTATSNNTSFSSAASGNASTISAILSSNYGGTHENILSQILSPGRLMNPHHLGDLTDNTKTDNNSMSLLNYGGLSQDLRSIHMGTSGGSLMSCVDEWRTASHHHQQQILGGGNLEDSNPNPSSNGFYPFESTARITSASISSALASQFSSVKVEDNNPYKWVNVNGNCSSWTDLSTFGASR